MQVSKRFYNLINKINFPDFGFYESCKKGQYINITKYIKDKIPYNLNKAFLCACKGGHKKNIKFFISQGFVDLDRELKYVCVNGNREIIDFLITKGARDWNLGAYGACKGSHKEIAEYMISLGVNDFELALLGTWYSGNKEIDII